jgi:peroxiredoxin
MQSLILTLTFLILLATGPSFAQSKLTAGTNAPNFSVRDLDGNSIDLAEMRSSVVVIAFWSTKCEICRREFPNLNKLVESYRGKNIQFLSPSMESEDRIQIFMRSNRIASRVLPNSFGLVMQYADNDGRGRIDMGFPSYFVIGTDGRLRFRDSGWNKLETLRRAIDRSLSN